MVLMAVAFTFDPKQPVHCRGMVTYAGAMPVYFGVFAGLAVVGAAGIKFNPLMALTPVLFLGEWCASGEVVAVWQPAHCIDSHPHSRLRRTRGTSHFAACPPFLRSQRHRDRVSAEP